MSNSESEKIRQDAVIKKAKKAKKANEDIIKLQQGWRTAPNKITEHGKGMYSISMNNKLLPPSHPDHPSQKPKLPSGKLMSESGPDSFMKYLIPIVVFSSILASTIFFLYKDNAQSLNKKQQAYDSGKRAAEINLEPNCNPYIMLDAKQSKEWLDGYMSVKTNPEKRTP